MRIFLTKVSITTSSLVDYHNYKELADLLREFADALESPMFLVGTHASFPKWEIERSVIERTD